MQLTLWSYEGPPHVGAMRIAASMKGVHCVLHAPQGDTYADLLFTMIERRPGRPPVSYTTFNARHLGRDTAELVRETVTAAYRRYRPEALLVGDSCTAELLQDQPGDLARGMDLPVPVIGLELSAYSRKEGYGASEAFYQLVRGLLEGDSGGAAAQPDTARAPRANLLGPTSLGFRCRDDVQEVARLLESVGVEVNVVAPLGASPDDLRRIPEADFNVCLYPEVARTTCDWLQRRFGQPTVTTVPLGLGATRDFLAEVGRVTGLDVSEVLAETDARMAWYSRSVDSNYLTGKRVFIFGDGTHAVAAARIASEELGFQVVGLGTYAREEAREVRRAAKAYGVEPLITDDYLEVERAAAEASPELVLGTQMERHIAKRLGLPCAVISAPVHVQDFPARYAPNMGLEGANVIFDTWVHPLMMGLEEHLLGMFKEDFEFTADAPSHLEAGAAPASGGAAREEGQTETTAAVAESEQGAEIRWTPEAEAELKKIPFFVRGKARRNTERFAADRGIATITVETIYDAKAHFSR
ncbi:ferredoxin:protochlorophyllide reductase (ATP-dependent) subunit B [Halorhodospira sp. 9621]|uniref:ferredoxin:protochlorophyllide reductase (ATP-dependent) subunit B n=1 Tax=Halorhodospira TaxID=85108 RepID=UPI001913D0D9|nr:MULTISPECIES: ferredoxin:protochlorophyllide reductase (ATP-dependent) subunit B [Halorhodospira]MBK5936444.1 ferredoxin:protochlorophyllide reductase (ATP-dependent) subunit B [Halorhodospira halophila]MBK5943948.1 ferredoxin:protochlorophyllide reductase (ATP-dependent) subunit B [Halorhodospira halophila]MCG5527937.1 ferredoxin:protochlorophyllide reductase (ATP-dependent) subunit B [Halorhodospira halophila]MCG5533265.1 ferredoxin:protochlorophyllide reductase (ATP-dependent) subunit B [